MDLFLGSSSYCFNLFCKGVHWLRSISIVSCYSPVGFPTQNAPTTLLAACLCCLTPVLRIPKKSLTELAAILHRHNSLLEFKVVVQAAAQVLGKPPTLPHVLATPSGKEKRSVAPQQWIKPQCALNPSNRITKGLCQHF